MGHYLRHLREVTLYMVRCYSFILRQCIPALRYRYFVLRLDMLAIFIGHIDTSLDALRKPHRLAVGNVYHPTRATALTR